MSFGPGNIGCAHGVGFGRPTTLPQFLKHPMNTLQYYLRLGGDGGGGGNGGNGGSGGGGGYFDFGMG